jgi:acyl-CoA synthetase (NDP forming)
MNPAESIIAGALASRQSTLSEFDSKRLLATYGIPTTRELLVDSLAEAETAAAQIGYPVVLKVCSAVVAHKTEHGLIELGITHVSDLKKAFNRLAPKAKESGGRVLVQELVAGSRELVMGLIRDPLLGPCVMFGLGGIFTEILQDVAFRVAPLSANDALDMIQEIKSCKLLQGIRGMESVDLKELSGYLVQLGRIGTEHPAIRAIDINPLIVRQGHPVAVDALVEVAEAQPQTQEDPIAQPSSLKPFFEPSSVVVIGASQTPHKPGNEVIRNILANEYEGGLYLVNPRGGEILGQKVHRSIQELPDGIDVAIIILPAAATPQAIRDCATKGIKAIVLAAGGFAEVDERGEALQAETILAVRETGVRVIGPNTSGHTSMPYKFTSSFYALGKIPRGHVSYLAQTGNFATHTMRYIKTGEHFGVARVVGLGNKVDVEESEVLEYYGNDSETKAIFVYLESFKRPRRFLEVARRVTRHKPVVMLKGGATQEGARAAVAHTAALASDDRIIDGALQQAGVVRIVQYSHLFLAAKALATMPLPRNNRVSFMAPSGAMLVSMTDFCQRHLGLRVPDVEESTRRRLQEISPAYIRMRNPVDIWPAASVSGVDFAYGEAADAVMKDPNIDALVMILMLTDETGVPPLDFVVDVARRYPEKPLYVTFSGQKKHMDAAKAFLEPRGVPTFPLIEEPFEVLSILARCRRAMERP